VAVVLTARTGGDPSASAGSSSTTAALPDGVDLERRVVLAYGPLADHLLAADRARVAVEAGTGDLSAYRDLLGATDASTTTEAELAGLERTEAHPALGLYRDAAVLYRQHLAVARAAIDVPDPLGAEVARSAARLRLLADRLYDRARVRLVGEDPDAPGVEVQRPDEVPDFAYEGLAPGPPLHEGAVVAPVSSGQSVERPTIAEPAWLAAVDDAEVPTGEELRDALAGAEPVALVALADRFAAAEEVLRAAPDPAGQPERARLTRLAALVEAEAARVGAAAGLAPNDSAAGPVLRAGAADLAGVGTALWESGLGSVRAHG
jgi:hypothetical protein